MGAWWHCDPVVVQRDPHGAVVVPREHGSVRGAEDDGIAAATRGVPCNLWEQWISRQISQQPSYYALQTPSTTTLAIRQRL